MGGPSVRQCLNVIFMITVVVFNITEYASAQNVATKYIEIDHELTPRKIVNINDLSPLPVPPGRESFIRKYPAEKRQIQDLILEIDKKKNGNRLTNLGSFPASSVPGSGTSETESQIRNSKLKSVLGTTGEVYHDADWGLMSTILTCYNNHWILRTGPEDWWTVVIRRIVQAMDEHGEVPQVRNFFVAHEGKKKLEVIVGRNLSNIDYSWLFSQFSDKIKENLNNPNYVDIITNDFSSSTGEQKMISNIMLMSSVKSYFEFSFGTACGIPGVEMKGTQTDWYNLLDKINRLQSLLTPINKYLHLTPWFKNATKVFNNLYETYKGNPNAEWWSNILSWTERHGSGQHSYFSGWFPDFFGAKNEPGDYLAFPSDLVTVPIHISDTHNPPPVEDDAILVAGIIGFNVENGTNSQIYPVVEPKHAWSLLLPETSPVADRLTGRYTGNVPVAPASGQPNSQAQRHDVFPGSQDTTQNNFRGTQNRPQVLFQEEQSRPLGPFQGTQFNPQGSSQGAQGHLHGFPQGPHNHPQGHLQGIQFHPQGVSQGAQSHPHGVPQGQQIHPERHFQGTHFHSQGVSQGAQRHPQGVPQGQQSQPQGHFQGTQFQSQGVSQGTHRRQPEFFQNTQRRTENPFRGIP